MGTRPRRTPKYTIKFECLVDGRSIIESLTPKDWSATFVELPESYQAVLAAAQTLAESAAGDVEGLRDEIQEWYDNLPEAFQQGDKGSELEECSSALEEIKDTLERADFDDVKLDELGDERTPVRLAVVVRMEASNIKVARKKAEAAYPSIQLRVQLISTESKSRADRLDDAMSDVGEAASLLEHLEEELGTTRELQQDEEGIKPFREAMDALHELAEALVEVDGSNVSFPGMY